MQCFLFCSFDCSKDCIAFTLFFYDGSNMEFGKLSHVDHVNWSIPPDDKDSKEFLRQLLRSHFQIYFGAPAWSHKEWLGKVYPLKCKSSDYLFYYAQKFSTIELNTTHYRIPDAAQTEKWLKQVHEQFLFCPKVFQGISHSSTGLLDRVLLKEWFGFLQKIQDHRGPCFLQFPPHFDYSQKARLYQFLQLWPQEFELALEFRHPSWLQDGQILPALRQFLEKQKKGLVVLDVAGRRDLVHTSISTDYAMIRFIGNNLHASDFSRATDWAERFANWKANGLRRLFLFIHEPDDILVPEMTEHFLKQINTSCGMSLEFSLVKDDRQSEQQSFMLERGTSPSANR